MAKKLGSKTGPKSAAEDHHLFEEFAAACVDSFLGERIAAMTKRDKALLYDAVNLAVQATCEAAGVTHEGKTNFEAALAALRARYATKKKGK